MPWSFWGLLSSDKETEALIHVFIASASEEEGKKKKMVQEIKNNAKSFLDKSFHHNV